METEETSPEENSPGRTSIVGLLLKWLLICLFLFTFGYTVVREYQDGWFWKRNPIAQTDEPEPIEAREPVPTLPPPAQVELVLDYEGAEDQLQKELMLAQSTLTLAMEERLKNRLARLEEEQLGQAENIIEVQTTVNELVGEVLQELDGQSGEWDPGRLIDETRSGLTALQLATNDLDHAALLSEQSIGNLREMGEISASIYDERNYDFQTYKVGRNETLSDIVRNAQEKYSIPQANLNVLISLFNEVSTGILRQGNRRMPKSIVLNNELRIPVPRNAGELASDFKLPEKLKEQQQVISTAQEEQRKISQYLSQSIGSLRTMVERMEAIKALAILIQQNVDQMDTDSIQIPGEPLTEEQQQAWTAFNQAMSTYEFSGGETEESGLAPLREATRALMEVYVSDVTDNPVEENLTQVSDIHWFKDFIQRYDPGKPASKTSLDAAVTEEL